ncbi:MAG TPA: zinc ribbon domain-containing protein [Propionibacteriaceae bacterium]|nr:zinc ribbon domain-containing protein [Propionibacteriaceae bacterium]
MEVITIDLICEVCGTANPPGTEFCTNCNSYLAWDRSVLVSPPTGRSKPGPPAPNPPAPTNYPTPDAPTVDYANTGDPPGYPDPGYGAQGYPDQGYGGQGYPDQGYPDQGGYADQGYYGGGYAPAGDQSAYADFTCPTCGRVNPATRRFCSRCGYAFFSSEAPDPYAGTGGGWGGSEAAQDRAARREYRRSLPPLYRWRRVIIGALVVILVGVGAVTVGRDPVGVVKGGWYTLKRQYLKVSPSQVQVVPPEATAANSDPAALVDGSIVEWTMNWQPSQEVTCGAAVGTGEIVLTFPPTRIRQVQIFAGLDRDNPQRNLQRLPKTMGLTFDNNPCQQITLTNTTDRQPFKIDSGKPVSQLRIGVASAFPAAPDAAPFLSITEVILKSFPS